MGRDPATCDLVLSDTTVSRLQAEIFFDAQQQRFFLRSLNQNNPPVVNGGKLPIGEVFLTQGSTVRLGNVDLTVASVTQRQHLGGTVPTPPTPLPVEISSKPLPPTEPSRNQEELQFAPPPVPTQYRQEVPNPVAVEAEAATVAVDKGKWTKEEWDFYWGWVLVTIGGIATFGLLLGLLQWLVLRQRMKHSGGWVWVTTLGVAVAWLIVQSLYLHYLNTVIWFLLYVGVLVTSILQWLVLQNRVHRAQIWVGISFLGALLVITYPFATAREMVLLLRRQK